MKTFQPLTKKFQSNCLFFKQALGCFLIFSTTSLSAIEVNYIERKPASIEEEVLTVPLAIDTFSNETLFAEDDSGVMRDLKATLQSWDSTDEYANKWDLKSTGLFNTPDTIEKRKFIEKKLLRYVDKRLSGEMKKAEEGSALHKVSKVEKQLRPNASVNISKNFGLKFKARVIQGKATVEFKNPWIECNTVVSAAGKIRVITRKEFKGLGTASGAEYGVNEAQIVTYVDQQLSNNIKARISSTQTNSLDIFSNDADARVEMSASFPFNL
ncbi:MAG: hypothetical protein HOP07_04040 [Bacteriovoracaceae bacterium]|nr:hypothetical protein [Bacteriovoracaceae bacterium]